MNLLGRIFTSKIGKKQKGGDEIIIYLDSEFKKNISTKNQNVDSYIEHNGFERDEFLYLCVKLKKTDEINLGQCLDNFNHEQYKSYLILGYSNERNTIPKINPVTVHQSFNFMRTGTVRMSLDSKKGYEQCTLKLHHDYLTYLPSKQKKISFIPLENASVQFANEKECSFKIKDKYKGIIFKSASKVISISAAIETRCSQMYMKDLNEKLEKKVKDKLSAYRNRCNNIIKQNRSIFLNQIGVRALRLYFKNNNQNQIDIKLFGLYQVYKEMCKVKREKGELESQPYIRDIQNEFKKLREELPSNIKDKNFDSKQQLIKALQEVMKYLDEKYKKLLVQKKIIQSTFQSQILYQHKQGSKIQVKTLFGNSVSSYK